MQNFTLEILKFLFFPFYLIIILPILIVAKFLNQIIHLSDSISNIKFFSLYDHYVKKLILVDKGLIKNGIRKYDKDSPLTLLDEFAFPLSLVKKKDLTSKDFVVSIPSKNKKDAIRHLKEICGEIGFVEWEKGKRYGAQIYKHLDINKILMETDKKFGTHLYKQIIEERTIPNYVRSDLNLWHNLEDAVSMVSSVEELRTKPLDIIGSGAIVGKFWTVEDYYPSEISKFSDFRTKIKLNLWRSNKVDIEAGVGDTSEILGQWIYQLSLESRKFLYLSVKQSKNLDNLKTTIDIDFYLRNIFYGILQSADTEINNRISIPFKNSLSNINIDTKVNDYEEFKYFLMGKYPPSMGGVGKFLDFIRKNKGEDIISEEFRNFVNISEYLNIEDITEKRFIQKLYQLGRLRGSIMHPDKINIQDCLSVIDYLFDYKNPGEFFYKIGIDKGY